VCSVKYSQSKRCIYNSFCSQNSGGEFALHIELFMTIYYISVILVTVASRVSICFFNVSFSILSLVIAFCSCRIWFWNKKFGLINIVSHDLSWNFTGIGDTSGPGYIITRFQYFSVLYGVLKINEFLPNCGFPAPFVEEV